MRSLALIICMCLFLLRSQAQTITGQVKDIQNEPVQGATVQLLKTSDSSIVQAKITRDNGKFEFVNLSNGIFVVQVTAIGSKPYLSIPLTIDQTHASVSLPPIILVPEKQKELKEVVVTSKKPLIEQDIDKTILNVEAMISSATSNALEVLEKTPGVTVAANGEISLNGMPGVLVLIDGRQTFMSGPDLAAYLRSLPGSTLDKIELMTNPPAKYDAAGNSVINIRLKRNKVQGYTGNASLSFSQGVTHSSYNSLNLNYLNKKINIFGNINRNMDRNFDDDSYDRIFYDSNNIKTSSTDLQNYYQYSLKDLTLRAGMDYNLSAKTAVGFVTSVYRRNKTDNLESHNNSSSEDESISYSSGYGNTEGSSQWKQATANINMLHRFNTSGRELSVDVNYISYNNNAKRVINNFIAATDSGADSNYIFQYDLPSDISIYNFKADYAHPLKNKASLSAGVKSSLVKNNSVCDYTDIVNNIHKPDLSKSNHFIYSENINAIYVNARKDWQRFGMQTGLRVENTNTKGHQLGNDIVPDSMHVNHYSGVFPSLFVSYKLDSSGKNTLTFNISRRINRPNYQQLNPFLVFIDQYSYTTGNPFLNPSYSNSMELNYRYKQLLGLTFQYNGINDAFFNATQSVNTIFITRPENASTRYMMAVLVNLNFPVAKWWKFNLNMGGAHFVTKGTVYDQSLDESKYACRFNLLNQFSFPKDWSAEISSRYTSSTINLQRIYGHRYQLNAGIQKKILKGKGYIKLNIDDIFWTLKQKDQTTGLKLAEAYHINIQDTRRVGVAFNFNFGKETFARKRRNNDNAADDVKGRAE